MPRIIAVLLLALGLLIAPEAGSQARPVYLIALDDDIINPGAAEYIGTAIDRAEAEGATALVIDVDPLTLL